MAEITRVGTSDKKSYSKANYVVHDQSGEITL